MDDPGMSPMMQVLQPGAPKEETVSISDLLMSLQEKERSKVGG